MLVLSLGSHAENHQRLASLRARPPAAPRERAFEGADTWALGTHPDLVDYLWFQLGERPRDDYRRIAYETPLLVAREAAGPGGLEQ